MSLLVLFRPTIEEAFEYFGAGEGSSLPEEKKKNRPVQIAKEWKPKKNIIPEKFLIPDPVKKLPIPIKFLPRQRINVGGIPIGYIDLNQDYYIPPEIPEFETIPAISAPFLEGSGQLKPDMMAFTPPKSRELTEEDMFLVDIAEAEDDESIANLAMSIL